MTESFGELLESIESALAFETSHYNESYLDRRINARIRRTTASNYDEYRHLLAGDEEEQRALRKSLSINVTGFFRNPDVWPRLVRVLERLTEDHRRVRVWSAPCSDGREPYSLAMAALDNEAIDERCISITATDLSAEAIERARAGRYETSAVDDVAAELAILDDYDQYVERQGEEFVVADAVRDLVEFDTHDLIRGDPVGTFEVVLCRNLLIYIDPEYKESILETLQASLVPAGVLVIGMSETLTGRFRSQFEKIEEGTRIYRKVGDGE